MPIELNRILSVGIDNSPVRSSSLFEGTNVEEFKAIFWRPAPSLQSIGQIPPHNHAAFENFLAALAQWVEKGNALYVFVESPHETFQFVAQGRGIINSQVWELPLLTGLNRQFSRGRQVQPCANDTANEILQPLVSDFSYDVLISGAGIYPLFRVSSGSAGPDQLVGGYRRYGRGFIIFLPKPQHERLNQNLLTALTDLPPALAESAPEIPEWAENFVLPDEGAAHEQIRSAKSRIAEIENDIASHQQQIDRVQPIKQLMWSTGDGFVSSVITALTELGLRAVRGPHPRADILALYGSRVLAIEAKGIEGPAREANLRQAEAWVTDVRRCLSFSPDERQKDPDMKRYAEVLGSLGVAFDDSSVEIGCKGLMIIGTFRKSPLDKRTEPDFPHPVALVIDRSHVCAMTGLQLLVLVMRGGETRQKVIDTLFDTNGVMKDGRNWQVALTQCTP